MQSVYLHNRTCASHIGRRYPYRRTARAPGSAVHTDYDTRYTTHTRAASPRTSTWHRRCFTSLRLMESLPRGHGTWAKRHMHSHRSNAHSQQRTLVVAASHRAAAKRACRNPYDRGPSSGRTVSGKCPWHVCHCRQSTTAPRLTQFWYGKLNTLPK